MITREEYIKKVCKSETIANELFNIDTQLYDYIEKGEMLPVQVYLTKVSIAMANNIKPLLEERGFKVEHYYGKPNRDSKNDVMGFIIS